MIDGQLESKWSQLHYATRTLSPVRLVLKVTLFCYCIVQGCFSVFLSPPPEGGLDLVTNRQGAI